MKHPKPLLILLASVILFACGTEDGKKQGVPDLPYWEANQCPRSIPEPVLKTIMLPDHAFKVDSIKGTGTETASMEGGGKITITHSGCENFTMTYRIETPNPNALDSNIPKKYFEAIGILTAVEPIDDSPTDFRKAQDVFMSYAKNKAKEHKLGELLYISEGEIAETVSLDKVEEANGNRIWEITFSSGPL